MGAILVLHGPNLNMLGRREQQIYGQTSLDAINAMLRQGAQQAGHQIDIMQSNHEGALVDCIQQRGAQADILIMNPAAFTHTSVAIRDAVLAVNLPLIEVHLSNIYRRESFRKHSYFADIAIGQVAGFGAFSYQLALHAACDVLRQREATDTGPAAGACD